MSIMSEIMSPIMIGILSPIIGVDVITSQFLTGDGSSTFGSHSSISLISGDTITINAVLDSTGSLQTLIDSTGVNKPTAQVTAANLLDFNSALISSVTISGSSVADGASVAAFQDGKLREIIVTISGASTIDRVGGDSAGANNWGNVFADYSVDANSVITTWAIDSGSTTSEEASVGSGTLTFNGVVDDDWELLTQDGTDWIGIERWTFADPSISSGSEGIFTTMDGQETDGVLTSGTEYRFGVTVSSLTVGLVRLQVGNTNAINTSSNGDFSGIVNRSSSTRLRTLTGGTQPNAGASLSSITVKRFLEVV